MAAITARVHASCIVICSILVACGTRDETRTTQTLPSVFPRIGIAVRDTAGTWCAEFADDSTAPVLSANAAVTLVFPGEGNAPSASAKLRGKRTTQCHSEFAQSRWISYSAFDVGPVTVTSSAPPLALIVANEVKWTRGSDSVARADIDGDGVQESAVRCLADEGEHFSVWSEQSAGARTRRWHEYYDWGAFTERNCSSGEDGIDSSTRVVVDFTSTRRCKSNNKQQTTVSVVLGLARMARRPPSAPLLLADLPQTRNFVRRSPRAA